MVPLLSLSSRWRLWAMLGGFLLLGTPTPLSVIAQAPVDRPAAPRVAPLPVPGDRPAAQGRPAAPQPIIPPEAERVPRVTMQLIRPIGDWDRAELASDALQRIGPAAVPSVAALLRHPDPLLRRRAAQVLAGIGPEAHEAVPALVESLRDNDLHVQRWSLRALGQIGPAAAPAIPVLLDALRLPPDPPQPALPPPGVPPR